MKNALTRSMTFSVLGIVFIGLGLVLQDIGHVYFGLVWLAIALIAFLWKSKKKEKTGRSANTPQ